MWISKPSRIRSRKAVFLYYCERIAQINSNKFDSDFTEKNIDLQTDNEITQFLWEFVIEEEEKKMLKASDYQQDIEYIARYQLDEESHIGDIDRQYIDLMCVSFDTFFSTMSEVIDPFTDKFGFKEMDISRQSLLMIGVIEHNIIWTHQSVIVNECVELAKTYDDMSASKLINAILHRYFSWLSNPKITTSN